MQPNHIAARPVVHHIYPSKDTIRVIQAVKNFAKIPGVCHIGLGVTATNNQKMLRKNGIHAESWATETADDLINQLRSDKGFPMPISHVIVSSPAWVKPSQFKAMAIEFPNVEFVLLNHSGLAYLSIDKNGIENIKAAISLETEMHNFRVAGNNARLNSWLMKGLGSKGLLLTNLYDITSYMVPAPTRQQLGGGPLRIGSFGAARPWKNQLTSAEAAVQLARELGTTLELYVNSKRPDGGERMIESRAELFNGLRGCKIVEVPWEQWPVFRTTCGRMHLLFSPSFDETFNVVTADGIAAGVPSVTSSSLEWTPRDWWAECEDPDSIVTVAHQLLNDPHAINDGRAALTSYVNTGIGLWTDYLMGKI